MTNKKRNKIKDTSKMGNKTGRQPTLGKKWKVVDSSKMGLANKGIRLKKGHRDKIKKAKKGIASVWKNPEERKKKISTSRKGKYAGKNNPMWKGGPSKYSQRYKEKRLLKLEKLAGRKQSEQCEVCGALGRICFDHNHETRLFRGWICARCNKILGFAKDSPELLVWLSKYLYSNEL